MTGARADMRGFTLVEMSIVLVIIGLLTGGVLAGRDLIKAGKVKAQISQIDSYRSATNVFSTKYGYLPGDIPPKPAASFGFTARNGSPGQGDGNNIIQSPAYGFCYGGIPSIGEAGMFWMDISAAKLVDGSFTSSGPIAPIGTADTTIASGGIGLFFPPAKIGQGNYVYVWSGMYIISSGPSSGLYSTNINYFAVSEVTQVQAYSNVGKIVSSANIPVSQAYSIDIKVDDGLPTTGKVLAMYVNGDPTWSDNITDAYYAPFPNQTARSATSCFDNNNVAGALEQYSIIVNAGAGNNCALSFQF